MCMHSPISDLSCYITGRSHCLQNTGGAGVGWGVRDGESVGLETLTEAIWLIPPHAAMAGLSG